MFSNTNTELSKDNQNNFNEKARDNCDTQMSSILRLLRRKGDSFKVIGRCTYLLWVEILKTDQQGATLKGFFDAMKESGFILMKKALEMFFG